MIDLYLDPNTHDLVLDNFTFKITNTKQDEITQRLKVKLLYFKGEWIHNLNYGVPYFQEIFIKGVDLESIDEIYRTQIASEAGVTDLISYSSSFNSSTRELTVNAKVVTESGEILNLSFDI